MKKLINIILLFILLVMSIMNCILVRDLEEKTLELIQLTDIEPEIVFLDSLVYDTVYITKTEVVRLPIYNTDTILTTDTILVTDSVDVVIPINTYHYDTTLAQTAISFDLRGFQCKVDNLYLKSMKIPTIEQKVPKKWYDNFNIGVGLSGVYVEGFKIVPSVGIYYTLFSL